MNNTIERTPKGFNVISETALQGEFKVLCDIFPIAKILFKGVKEYAKIRETKSRTKIYDSIEQLIDEQYEV